MDMISAIRAVTERKDLSAEEMTSVMNLIMTGQATPAQIGGFLIGLRMKGETIDEIAAAAKVMRSLATPVQVQAEHVVDTCGTGGDGAKTFNISTASAFVAAAAGASVAKHGNRSVSSKSGSADVLEALGVRLDLKPEQVTKCVEDLGVGFMFAPMHHSAMKHAIGPRKEMGVRTLFNVLGPLTNPAGVRCQVIGVFAKQWQEPLAQVLNKLGSQHVLVVHSEDGMDEISIAAPTNVVELHARQVRTYSVKPEDFGLKTAPLADIAVDTVEESVAMLKGVLDNKAGAPKDVVCLNAGAAIYAAGLAEDLASGVTKAADVIASGEAAKRLQGLIDLSQSLAT